MPLIHVPDNPAVWSNVQRLARDREGKDEVHLFPLDLAAQSWDVVQGFSTARIVAKPPTLGFAGESEELG